MRGKRLVARGLLRVGEPLSFDGYRLTFPAIRRGGDILVQRDAGDPLLWLALVLALGGAAARILCPSTRVWLRLGGDGAHVLVREDAFAAGSAARLLARLEST